MRPTIIAILFLTIACAIATGEAFPRKKLAGPPEEFSNHRIPNPRDVLNVEHSMTQYIYLQRDDLEENGPVFRTVLSVPVDGDGYFDLSYASPYADKTQLTLFDPLGNKVNLKKGEVKDHFPIGVGNMFPVTGYLVMKSMKGLYVLHIHVAGLSPHEVEKLEKSVYPHALVTLFNNDDMVIESFLNSYEISVGKKISVSAKMTHDSLKRQGVESNILVSTAKLNMLLPDGRDVVIPMNDDGVRGDLLANDGVFGAEVPFETPGQYSLMPILSGFVESPGAEPITDFTRSSQHLVEVSEAALSLTGRARLLPKDSSRSYVRLGVAVTKAPEALRAYTEVYGVRGTDAVPVAWLGGLVDVEDGYVTLELDHKWLQRAGVVGDLFLRNTYLADAQTAFPVALFLEDMKVDSAVHFSPSRGFTLKPQPSLPITKEMRQGVNPLKNRTKTFVAGKKGLVLIPGYCASVNPWKRNEKDFTDAYFFDEMNLNVANDQYAKKVLAFAEKLELESFGLIGHSQGGKVALHIHNYYFSGLESASGPRLIQAVGTPWQGSTAAGDAADLGKVLGGVGCGANSDLTRDGAANWLAGITMDSRADVYYFTTSYKKGNLFGDYCSMAMNLILQWPNDAVTEIKYSKLEGAQNMGNKEKWCHTTELAYPAQYDDHDRNRDMNQQAAR